MKKSILTLTVLLSASSFTFAAHAATSADDFIKGAAIGGMFEINSSKLALEKSKDKDVLAFAQKMIADHSKADKKLKMTVAKAKLPKDSIPTALDEKHQKALDDLKTAKDEDFNKDYIKAQEDAHDEAVSLFKDYSENGDNAALKAFASKTLPTLQSHHDKVDVLEKKIDSEHASK